MPFPTHLLDARLARQKAANEQARQQILQMTQQWLGENATRYGIESGYIFGSVMVAGRFSDRSDVDLAVETHKTGDICALMGDLSIHINRDVDLVPLDQCHFAEKIRRTGLPWTQNASQG